MDRTLARLGRPSMGLMQLYWNDYDAPAYVEAALALQDLKARLGSPRPRPPPGLPHVRTFPRASRCASGARCVGSSASLSRLGVPPAHGRACRAVGRGPFTGSPRAC